MAKKLKEVDWIVVLVMSIFLGYFGVDRFVMGKIWTGILKLITFGGFGIWWIVDVVLVATKHKFDGIRWI